MNQTEITIQNAKEQLTTAMPIVLSPYYNSPQRKYWKLKEPLYVVLSNNELIIIPKDFVTDLSSVPKLLWHLFPPFGDFLLAALIHDYLYVEDYNVENLGWKEARKFADQEMLIWSNAINKNKLDNHLRYYAVRMFGKTLYERPDN
jgi:hypothetical protein